MSDDTDSCTSSSSERHKKHKKSNKLKRKSEKKKSKHKEKKEKRLKIKKQDHQETKFTIPTLNPHQSKNVYQSAETFGPALPPHLQKNESGKTLIGPVLPQEILGITPATKQAENKAFSKDGDSRRLDYDDEDFSYGPVPVSIDADGMVQMSDTQIELEQRALEIKLAGIGGTAGKTKDSRVREEWMLELPEVGLKSGLAALSNMKRTFHQGKEKPDFSDRTSWTKTPQDGTNPTPSTSKSATIVETLQEKAEAAYERKRDEEQERMAKKHKKEHKRDESLVEMHQKKLRKEQKKKEKELAASGEKPERRPFSRDVDLKLNKIDKNQTKQIVDKAKILNTKFASGKTKYL